MKKLSLVMLTLITIANAALPVHPLSAAFKSIDNGGTKQAIDAYKDGIGAEIVDNPGVVTDNAAMNTLVYKYGDAAKTSGITVVSQVMATGSVADKVIGGALTINGTSCNDNNAVTTGETWLNGVCQGGTMLTLAPSGLYYDNCESGARTWVNAGLYCASKGMRLPTQIEPNSGNNIPSCHSTMTWTSGRSGSNIYILWNGNSDFSRSGLDSNFVRCVK